MEKHELKMEELSRIAGGGKMTPDEKNEYNSLVKSYEYWQGAALQDPTKTNEYNAEMYFQKLDEFYTKMLKKYGTEAFYD